MLYTPARHSQTPSKTCLWLSNCQSRSHHSHLGTHIQPCLQMAWGPSETKKKKNHLNEYTRVTFKTKSYKILHIYKTLCVTAVLDRDALIAFYFVTNWHPISPVNNSVKFQTTLSNLWSVRRSDMFQDMLTNDTNECWISVTLNSAQLEPEVCSTGSETDIPDIPAEPQQAMNKCTLSPLLLLFLGWPICCMLYVV